MGMRKTNKVCWFVLVVALGVGTAVAQQSGIVDDHALVNADKNTSEWLTNGRDYSEQRYSPLNQVDTSNVTRLGLAWYYDTGSDRGTVETTPIISGGVMYATLPWSVVVALDACTGQERWRWDP